MSIVPSIQYFTVTKLLLLCFCFVGFTHCKSGVHIDNYLQPDSIVAGKFLAGRTLCDFSLAIGFKEIKPQMEPWATNPTDTFVESYIIDSKRLRIFQPLKQPTDMIDSARQYSYGGKNITTTRVLVDSLHFNFNQVFFDYGSYPHDIFRNGSFILLRNEPEGWTGLANTYRFIQLFDLQNLVCYEFFVNDYACLSTNSFKE